MDDDADTESEEEVADSLENNANETKKTFKMLNYLVDQLDWEKPQKEELLLLENGGTQNNPWMLNLQKFQKSQDAIKMH